MNLGKIHLRIQNNILFQQLLHDIGIVFIGDGAVGFDTVEFTDGTIPGSIKDPHPLSVVAVLPSRLRVKSTFGYICRRVCSILLVVIFDAGILRQENIICTSPGQMNVRQESRHGLSLE